jgi:hypothetical protein
MSLLIGLVGKARSGKDTVASMMVTANGCPFVRVAFADEVRRVAREMGWDGLKDERGRRLLQQLGGDVGRAYDPLLWVKRGMAKVRQARDDDGRSVVVTDCRYRNEVDAIRAAGGAIWRIVRHTGEGLTGDAAAHSSETALDDYKCDRVIVNDGTYDELRAVVRLSLYDLTFAKGEAYGQPGGATLAVAPVRG